MMFWIFKTLSKEDDYPELKNAVPHNLLFDYCGFPLHLSKMTLEVRFSQNAGEDFKDRTETNQPAIASYALLQKNVRNIPFDLLFVV